LNHLTQYYHERANEYDAIYRKPERQKDIRQLAALLADQLNHKRVLEVACGTGFWTQFYGPNSKSVLATDYNQSVLDIAEERLGSWPHVRLQQADGFTLKGVEGDFDAGLAAFWWSHLTYADAQRFLATLHQYLQPGSEVWIADNRYVEGSSSPICRVDEGGNTYQLRRLSDGREFEVLKNFPDRERFQSWLGERGSDLTFMEMEYFWLAKYRINE